MKCYFLAHRLLHTLEYLLLVKVDGSYGYFYGYDLGKRRPVEPVYSGIMGYGLSLHVLLHMLNKYDTRSIINGLVRFLVEACSRARDFAASYGYYLEGVWSNYAYSFDNGVVASLLRA